MKKSKKLSLKQLEVTSFITSLRNQKMKTAKGGFNKTYTRFIQGCTDNTIEQNPSEGTMAITCGGYTCPEEIDLDPTTLDPTPVPSKSINVTTFTQMVQYCP